MSLLLACSLSITLASSAPSTLPRPPVLVKGTAESYGLEAPFEVELYSSLFELRVGGRLPWGLRLAGERVWTSQDFSWLWHGADLRDYEVAVFDSLAWTRAYEADYAAVLKKEPSQQGAPSEWSLAGGALKAQVTLGVEGLIQELRIPGAHSGRTWTYEWQQTPFGWFPSRASLTTDEGLTHRFQVDSVRDRRVTDLRVRDLPTTSTRFEAAELPVPVRRAKTGHLFVRPLVNGRDLGWWLFDSGAGGTMLAAEAIEALELERFGEARLTGFGPDVHETSFIQLESVKLGSLEIRDLVALERAGPSMASRILGEPVAGVLGWDVFLRSVVTIDPAEGTVRVENPDAFDGGELDWQRLTLHWNVPYVTARFEGDREELFCLDTGAGSKSVIFHADAVERLELLDGRETTTFQGGGAGGAVMMKSGELEWFEIAGVRHEPAPAIFSAGEDGESDPYTAGFLGAGFLGDVKVVYDYGRKRVAFVPRD